MLPELRQKNQKAFEAVKENNNVALLSAAVEKNRKANLFSIANGG
jgi:hypothetical protein